MKITGVFLDRDGVLNPHIPNDYLKSAADAHLLPGVAHSIRRLNDAGLPVVVISNQQGVGKGVMSLADLAAIEARIAQLLEQEAGAHLTRSYYCTELAGAHSPRRKPAPGMLIEAAADLGLSLAQTVFAGDSATDIQAGHAAGVGATVLLLSGGIHAYTQGKITPEPDYIYHTLTQMTDWILETNA